MKKSNCIVAQSGGPTAAINASLAGVLQGAVTSGNYETVYGSVHGVQGILNNEILNLSEASAKDPSFVDRLIHTPAMYLGSCRYRVPDYREDETVCKKIFSTLEQLEISAFFYIGGNDSMDTVLKLSDYATHCGSSIRFLGIPKTIDNDLACTDHTPGFGSAAKYIACSVLETAHDAYIYPSKSVTIIEIMGRDAGWLTAASVLARNEYSKAPHLIYLPECSFDKESFLSDVSSELQKRDHVIIAISEGIHDSEGTYVSASSSVTDSFGHSQLSGAGKYLEGLVSDSLHVKVRSLEINVLQRAAAHLASETDLSEAFCLGKEAVSFAGKGATASMVALKRETNDPYTVSYLCAPIADIANKARTVPKEWINAAGNDVTAAMEEYLRPLIQGEPRLNFKNGLPDYMDISHLLTKKL